MHLKIKNFSQPKSSISNIYYQNQEIIELENESEEEQINLALLKSLEEINQKKEKKEKFINLIDGKTVEDEEEIENEEEYDENFGICPITRDYMKHPMLFPSGNYYEKKAIFRWINENHNDPITREFLSSEMLVEDLDYKRKIREYIKKRTKEKVY